MVCSICPLCPHRSRWGFVVLLDAPIAARLFTFGPCGRVLHWEARECSQKSAKIGKANGMHNLPNVRTQVTKTGNVDSLDIVKASQLFTFGPKVQGSALRGS